MSVLCQNNRTLRCSVQVKQEKSIRCRNQTAPGLKLLIGTTGRRSLQRRGNTTPRGLRRPVTNAAVFSHGHEVQPEENRELTILLEKYNIVLYLQRRREPAADWEVSSCCTSGATSHVSQLQTVICTVRTCRNPPARPPHVQQQPGVAGTRCNTYLHGTILQPLVRAFFWSHSRLLRTWSADVHRYQSKAVR